MTNENQPSTVPATNGDGSNWTGTFVMLLGSMLFAFRNAFHTASFVACTPIFLPFMSSGVLIGFVARLMTANGFFWYCAPIVTNEPNLLKTQGVETKTFLLADYKYPLVSETYVVKKSSLTSKRDEIKAMLVADIKGWQQNIKDPTIGAKLAANVYGKDQKLTVAEQTLESTSENSLIATAETKTNGLFTITDALIDENISTLALANINITKEKLFDMSVLAEVYSEHPELKTFTTA